MTTTAFELRPANDSGARITGVAGEVDTTNAAQFTAAVRELPGHRPLVLDIGGLSYVDSAGFAALDRLLADETIVIVLAPHSVIHKAATLVGLPCHDTVEIALAATR